MNFYEEKSIGYCGLACVLCSAEDCLGCKERGKKEGCDCSVYKCATEKGVNGCYECPDYESCGEQMPKGLRSKAFNSYAKQFGEAGLISRLKSNFEAGVVYHKADGSKGDYDVLSTEEEIMDLLKNGKA